MLRTFNMLRQTGKTTRAIILMESFDEAVLVIPNKFSKKLYPCEMQGRIVTVDEVIKNYVHYSSKTKVVIDEGFLLDKESLAHLYYTLGQARIDVVALGTVE